MAKERVYGFDEQGFERVQRATREVLGTARTGARRRRQVPVLTGGTTSIVQGGGGAFTVAEYDPITGDILQTFDRGMARVFNEASHDIGILVSSDGYLYATGIGGIRPTIAPDGLPKDGYLVKWDIDTGEKVWDSTAHPYHPVKPVTGAALSTSRIDRIIFENDDGSIWVCVGPNSTSSLYAVARHDPDSGAQTGEFQQSSFGHGIFPHPTSGSAIIGSGSGSNTIRVLDSSLTSVAGVNQTATCLVHDGTDLIAGTVTTLTIRDGNTLSSIASGNVLAAASVLGIAGDGSTIWAASGSTGSSKLQAFNYSLVEQWQISRPTSNDLLFSLQLHDGYLYDFSQVIRRLDPADGSVVWTAEGPGHDALGVKARESNHGWGSNFLVSGQNSGNTAPGGLMCINTSDGSLRWQDEFLAYGVVVTPDDRVFACGAQEGTMSLDGTATTGINPGDPTPEEIAAITADIRQGWSDVEHYRRAGLPVPHSLDLRRRARNEESEPLTLLTDWALC